MSTTETLTGQVLAGRGLSMSRGGRQILSGLDIVAEPGEVVALTGPSGSGKSTLLSVLGLLERPDDGEVVLGERALSVGTESVRTSFGLVLQGYGLVSMLTAAENVELPLQARGLPPAEVRERAAEELTRLGLPDLAERLVDQLSGGQQQRVAVARALAGDPPIILADEPTAALDPATRQLVLSRLFAAARRGAVVVLATHDREVADQCDREVAMADGRVVLPGGSPAGLAREAAATVVRDAGRHRLRADSAPTGPAQRLLAAGVTYARGGRQILTGVDLDARAGRLLAVTGPSGAGKSSLLALLAALDRPDQGVVSVDGQQVSEAIRARCGLVLQGYALLPVLTAAETVELPLQRLRLDRQVVRVRAHAWLERLGLDAAADQLLEELSGGQQQRLAVARALVTEPEIVLADEPTAELDAENRDLVCRLLIEQAARGVIVVLATHDDQVADRCNDRLHLAGRGA